MPSAGSSATSSGGTPSEDVDILVARRPLEDIVAKIEPHGKVDLVGKSFGIIKFTIKGKSYDIALPRPTGRKAKARAATRTSLSPPIPIFRSKPTLKRRDFRCNSIALRLADGATH